MPFPAAQAAAGGTVQAGWSPTKPYPSQEVYYPRTEELGPGGGAMPDNWGPRNAVDGMV